MVLTLEDMKQSQTVSEVERSGVSISGLIDKRI